MSNFSVKGEVGLNTQKFESGTKRVNKSVERMGKSASALKSKLASALAVGAVIKAGRGLANLAGALTDNAAAAGLTTDAFQALEFAAKKQGASTDQLVGSLETLQEARSKAIKGDQSEVEAFEALGITVDQVAKKSLPELLKAIADGRTGSTRFAEALVLGAGNAAKLQTTLDDLSTKGMGGLITEATEAGQIIDADFTESLDKVGKAVESWGRKVQVFAINRIAEFIDGLRLLKVALGAVIEGGLFSSLSERKNLIAKALAEEVAAIEAEDKARRDRQKAREKQDQKDREQALIIAEEKAAKAGAKKTREIETKTAVDSLRRIGAKALGGARVDTAQMVRKKQLTASEKIAKATAEVEKTMKRIEVKLGGGSIL